jgi:hypothetical protein
MIPAEKINSKLKRDLLNVCIHEASHLMLIKMFGGSGYIFIDSYHFKDSNEMSYIGRVNATKLTSNTKKRQMIGAAGHIGEYILDIIIEDSGLDEADALSAFETDLISDELSKSDARLVKGINEETFFKAYNLIKQNWFEIEAEAAVHYNQRAMFIK